MSKFNVTYKKPRTTTKNIEPFTYDASRFGISGKCSGYSTSFAIIGSGLPSHKDLNEFSDLEVFVEETSVPDDLLGLSTMHAGIIASNNIRGMRGFAQKSKPLYVKAINERKETSINALASSILWCIIKQSDVAVLTFFPESKSSYIEEILRKAYIQNVCVYVHESNVSDEWKGNPHMTIVHSEKGNFGLNNQKNKMVVSAPGDIYTTYVNNKYIIAKEDILSVSTVAGLALILIQKNKNNKTKYTPLDIYKQILSL